MNTYGLEPVRFLSRDAQIVRGIKQIVTVPQPAAGADWTVKVPGGEQWFIMSGKFGLSTSAVVANRIVQVVVTVDGPEVYRALAGTAVAASSFPAYTLAQVDAPVNSTSLQGLTNLQIPWMPLPQGATVGSLTVNLDVGDQYGAVNLYVARVYLPDQKLDEIAECEQRAYFDAMHTAATRHGA